MTLREIYAAILILLPSQDQHGCERMRWFLSEMVILSTECDLNVSASDLQQLMKVFLPF